jgi:hypothetical protein
VQCSVQLRLQFRYSSVSRRLTSSSSSSSSSMPGRRSRRLQKQKDSRASALPYRPWCMLLTTDYHCTHRARTKLAAARAKATRKHMLTARPHSLETLCRHFTHPPSQEPRPSAFSAIRPLPREDVKRVDSASTASGPVPTSIQHTLAHVSSIQSTRPVSPGHHSESSSSVTCP